MISPTVAQNAADCKIGPGAGERLKAVSAGVAQRRMRQTIPCPRSFPARSKRGAASGHARLNGVEKATYVQVADFARVTPFANEDLDRATEVKTSAVHFLRFELTPEMVAAAKAGAPIRVGVDHPHYKAEITLSHAARESLAMDLR